MKAFVLSQFNYCRLIWMFHSMQLNNRINKTNERAFHMSEQQKVVIRILDTWCLPLQTFQKQASFIWSGMFEN